MTAIAALIEGAMPRTRIVLPLAAWIRTAAERRALGRLTDAQLADIGLSRAAAEAEAARPFWDLPHGRR